MNLRKKIYVTNSQGEFLAFHSTTTHLFTTKYRQTRGGCQYPGIFLQFFFAAARLTLLSSGRSPAKAGHPSLTHSIRHLPISFFLNIRSLKNFLRDLAFLGGGVGLSPQNTQCKLPIFRTGLKYTKSPSSCQPIFHWSEVV